MVPLISPSLLSGAIVLAFPACPLGLGRCTSDLRGFPDWGVFLTISRRLVTLDPSPRLQRLSLVRAVHPRGSGWLCALRLTAR